VLKSVRHIPGAMFPVSPSVASRRERLFSRNERVCLLVDSQEHGQVCIVFVGALNVGSIVLNHLPMKTNNSLFEVFFPPPIRVEYLDRSLRIGEEVGKFNLGSTVIVLVAKESELKCEIGDKVKMGQGIS